MDMIRRFDIDYWTACASSCVVFRRWKRAERGMSVRLDDRHDTLASMGLYITLQGANGEVVRDIPDPFGGRFGASGDFDDLLGRGTSPLLDAVDSYGVTTLPSSAMQALAAEVDALLATVPEEDRGRGRAGTAWRGLTRFRVMVHVCGTNDRYTLRFVGD